MIEPARIVRGLRNSRAFAWVDLEREIDEEIRFHLDMRVEENLGRGMTPDEAYRDAVSRFGDIPHIRAECLRARLESPLSSFLERARVALLIAVGVGVLLSVLILVDQTLLGPLPYENSDRIVTIAWGEDGKEGRGISAAEFLELRENETLFRNAGLFYYRPVLAAESDVPRKLRSLVVSAGFFEILNLKLWLGRGIRHGDDTIGADPVVLLSHDFWRRRYNGRTDIIGRSIRIDTQLCSIVGIMPPDFHPLYNIDVVLPLALPTRRGGIEDRVRYMMLAELEPGVQPDQAADELVAITEGTSHPASGTDKPCRVKPLREVYAQPVRVELLVLLIAVGLLLLVSSIAAAGRVVERAARRDRHAESRRKTYRFLSVEVFLPALLGTGLGFLIGLFAADVLSALFMKGLAHVFDRGISGSILLGTLGLFVLLAGGIASVAIFVRRGRSIRGLRTFLLAAPISLALMVLISAGLTIRHLYRVESALIGFGSSDILTVRIALPTEKYPNAVDQARFFHRALTDIECLPGVERVSAAESIPLLPNDVSIPFAIVGRSADAKAESMWGEFSRVGTDYHTIMGITLIAGRYFTAQDARDTAQVVLINRAMAERYWPGESPIGRKIFLNNVPKEREIVGVVENTLYHGVEREPSPRIYRCYWQFPSNTLRLVIRTSDDTHRSVRAVRAAIRRVDSTLVVGHMPSGRELLDAYLARRRLFARMLVAVAVAALLVVLFSVRREVAFAFRTMPEQTRRIERRRTYFLRPLAGILAASVAVGILGAWGGSSLLAKALYSTTVESFLGDGVDPTVIYVTACLLWLSLISLSALLPSRLFVDTPGTRNSSG